MINLLTPSTISEAICFAVTLFCLSKDASKIWRLMIIYLLITCVTEFYGKYLGHKMHNNQWVYNIFLFFEGAFTNFMFAYLFSKYMNSKPLIVIGLAIFFGCYAFELISHGFLIYNNLTYSVMSVVFVLYSLFYYYLLIKDEAYIYLRRSSEFWWVAGTLLFYFGATACNVFNDELNTVTVFKDQQLSYLIFKILNVILYGCWSYAFICRRWKR